MKRIILMIFFAFLTTTGILAQDACQIFVDTALELMEQHCVAVSAGTACLANGQLEMTDINGDSTSVTVGKRLGLLNAGVLTLHSTDMALGALVMALGESAQGASILVYGNVTMTSIAVERPVLLNSTVNSGVNVRNGPSTRHALVGALVANATVIADGRNTTGDWLRVQLDNGTAIGWVFASLVTVDDDILTLPILSENDTVPIAFVPEYAPMQTFTFDITESHACGDLPAGGILLQKDEMLDALPLRVNGIDLNMGSTIHLSETDGAVTASVLEGEIWLGGVRVPAGVQATTYAGEESIILRPYAASRFEILLADQLPHRITPVEPLSQATIDALQVTFEPGTWIMSLSSDPYNEGNCPGNAGVWHMKPVEILVTTDFDSRIATGQVANFFWVSPGVYQFGFDAPGIGEIRMVSPRLMEGTVGLPNGDGGCVSVQPVVIQKISD